MRSITNLGENLVSNENSQTGLEQDGERERERESLLGARVVTLSF